MVDNSKLANEEFTKKATEIHGGELPPPKGGGF